MFQNVEAEDEQADEHVDERSVDELLSFINGSDGGGLSYSPIFIYFHFTFCMHHISLNSD